ncbi:nitroreductase family protein [Salibaculum griseiflavum]|jgi:nitroreductase|uniref:Putative NAD(P)H nitroreductase n=1 Tax=Salibaculum griseiflavum TaxID=1914409 RepID=A0A2V1P8T1_9RHOB|nr:nitroreductase family protein [Salibaculum griseiflavum]PWG17767.1 nitroreductase [Salibaculum griseiflavum]
MPPRNQAALEFLLTRRSRPAKTLTTPVPNRLELDEMLTAAARTPDHGKLEPWRFIVLDRAVLQRLAEVIPHRHAAIGLPEEQLEKGVAQFRDGDLAVAVIESPVLSDKIPPVEQTYSAGAACLALLNAALAAGWGANWLTGWPVHDRTFVETYLNLTPTERVVGLVHIGTETNAPPERPRPDLSQKVTFLE